MFEKDWERVRLRDRPSGPCVGATPASQGLCGASLSRAWQAIACGLGQYIERMDDGAPGEEAGGGAEEVSETKEVLWEFHDMINAVFDYYACACAHRERRARAPTQGRIACALVVRSLAVPRVLSASRVRACPLPRVCAAARKARPTT